MDNRIPASRQSRTSSQFMAFDNRINKTTSATTPVVTNVHTSPQSMRTTGTPLAEHLTQHGYLLPPAIGKNTVRPSQDEMSAKLRFPYATGDYQQTFVPPPIEIPDSLKIDAKITPAQIDEQEARIASPLGVPESLDEQSQIASPIGIPASLEEQLQIAPPISIPNWIYADTQAQAGTKTSFPLSTQAQGVELPPPPIKLPDWLKTGAPVQLTAPGPFSFNLPNYPEEPVPYSLYQQPGIPTFVYDAVIHSIMDESILHEVVIERMFQIYDSENELAAAQGRSPRFTLLEANKMAMHRVQGEYDRLRRPLVNEYLRRYQSAMSSAQQLQPSHAEQASTPVSLSIPTHSQTSALDAYGSSASSTDSSSSTSDRLNQRLLSYPRLGNYGTDTKPVSLQPRSPSASTPNNETVSLSGFEHTQDSHTEQFRELQQQIHQLQNELKALRSQPAQQNEQGISPQELEVLGQAILQLENELNEIKEQLALLLSGMASKSLTAEQVKTAGLRLKDRCQELQREITSRRSPVQSDSSSSSSSDSVSSQDSVDAFDAQSSTLRQITPPSTPVIQITPPPDGSTAQQPRFWDFVLHYIPDAPRLQLKINPANNQQEWVIPDGVVTNTAEWQALYNEMSRIGEAHYSACIRRSGLASVGKSASIQQPDYWQYALEQNIGVQPLVAVRTSQGSFEYHLPHKANTITRKIFTALHANTASLSSVEANQGMLRALGAFVDPSNPAASVNKAAQFNETFWWDEAVKAGAPELTKTAQNALWHLPEGTPDFWNTIFNAVIQADTTAQRLEIIAKHHPAPLMPVDNTRLDANLQPDYLTEIQKTGFPKFKVVNGNWVPDPALRLEENLYNYAYSLAFKLSLLKNEAERNTFIQHEKVYNILQLTQLENRIRTRQNPISQLFDSSSPAQSESSPAELVTLDQQQTQQHAVWGDLINAYSRLGMIFPPLVHNATDDTWEPVQQQGVPDSVFPIGTEHAQRLLTRIRNNAITTTAGAIAEAKRLGIYPDPNLLSNEQKAQAQRGENTHWWVDAQRALLNNSIFDSNLTLEPSEKIWQSSIPTIQELVENLLVSEDRETNLQLIKTKVDEILGPWTSATATPVTTQDESLSSISEIPPQPRFPPPPPPPPLPSDLESQSQSQPPKGYLVLPPVHPTLKTPRATVPRPNIFAGINLQDKISQLNKVSHLTNQRSGPSKEDVHELMKSELAVRSVQRKKKLKAQYKKDITSMEESLKAIQTIPVHARTPEMLKDLNTYSTHIANTKKLLADELDEIEYLEPLVTLHEVPTTPTETPDSSASFTPARASTPRSVNFNVQQQHDQIPQQQLLQREIGSELGSQLQFSSKSTQPPQVATPVSSADPLNSVEPSDQRVNQSEGWQALIDLGIPTPALKFDQNTNKWLQPTSTLAGGYTLATLQNFFKRVENHLTDKNTVLKEAMRCGMYPLYGIRGRDDGTVKSTARNAREITWWNEAKVKIQANPSHGFQTINLTRTQAAGTIGESGIPWSARSPYDTLVEELLALSHLQGEAGAAARAKCATDWLARNPDPTKPPVAPNPVPPSPTSPTPNPTNSLTGDLGDSQRDSFALTSVEPRLKPLADNLLANVNATKAERQQIVDTFIQSHPEFDPLVHHLEHPSAFNLLPKDTPVIVCEDIQRHPKQWQAAMAFAKFPKLVQNPTDQASLILAPEHNALVPIQRDLLSLGPQGNQAETPEDFSTYLGYLYEEGFLTTRQIQAIQQKFPNLTFADDFRSILAESQYPEWAIAYFYLDAPLMLETSDGELALPASADQQWHQLWMTLSNPAATPAERRTAILTHQGAPNDAESLAGINNFNFARQRKVHAQHPMWRTLNEAKMEAQPEGWVAAMEYANFPHLIDDIEADLILAPEHTELTDILFTLDGLSPKTGEQETDIHRSNYIIALYNEGFLSIEQLNEATKKLGAGASANLRKQVLATQDPRWRAAVQLLNAPLMEEVPESNDIALPANANNFAYYAQVWNELLGAQTTDQVNAIVQRRYSEMTGNEPSAEQIMNLNLIDYTTLRETQTRHPLWQSLQAGQQ